MTGNSPKYEHAKLLTGAQASATTDIASMAANPASSSYSIAQFHPVPVESTEIMQQVAHEYAPGHEKLFIKACGHLNDAMRLGHKIYLKQFEPQSEEVLESLRWLVGCAGNYVGINSFIRACEINGGIYDTFSKNKIEPEFTPAELREAYAAFRRQFSEYDSRVMPLRELLAILFDPEVAPKQPNARGIYPESINAYSTEQLEEFQHDIAELPDGKSLYTAINAADEGKLVATRFNKMFKTEVEQLHQIVLRAAECFDALAEKFEGEKAEGLRIFSSYLKEHSKANLELSGRYPYSNSEILLNQTYRSAQAVPFAYYNGFGSSYSDTFHAKNFLSGALGFVTAQGAALSPFMDRMGQVGALEQNLPNAASIRQNVKDVPMLILDVVNRCGYALAGAQGIALTMAPDEKEIRNHYGSVIVCWRNVLEAKTQAILLPIARLVMDQEAIERHGDKFTTLMSIQQIIGVASHEQRHVIGDQLDAEEAASPAKLGKHFDTINEGLAEIGRLYSYREIIPKDGFLGINKEEILRFFYESYVSEMCRHIRGGKENPYAQAAAMRLNYLQQAGALEITEDLRIKIIDQAKLESATSDLYKLHLELRRTGDKASCQNYIDQYSIKPETDLDQKVTAIVDRLNRAGIPRDICMEYNFAA